MCTATTNGGRTFEWTNGSVAIGRHESNDVFLSDGTVSRWHAAIFPDGAGGWRLVDCGSRDGVRTAGARRPRLALEEDVSFHVGPYRIEFEREPAAAPGTDLIGASAVMRELRRDVERCASLDRDVLILGETGTGKELVARRIHELSSRADGPWVVVDANTVPAELFESELFGHVKGSFTGASRDRGGKVAAAEGGTLFLDEIGDLPAPLQGKIMRLLQEREYRRVGEDDYRRANVRILAATHRDLTAKGPDAPRLDLAMRLMQGVVLHTPPLRDRPEDVPLLSYWFLDQLGRDLDRRVTSFDADVLESFLRYGWPGNVRELRALIANATVFAEDKVAIRDFRHADHVFGWREDTLPSLAEVEREHVVRVLHATGGNQKRAAEILGINPNTLKDKMDRHGLVRGDFRTRKGS